MIVNSLFQQIFIIGCFLTPPRDGFLCQQEILVAQEEILLGQEEILHGQQEILLVKGGTLLGQQETLLGPRKADSTLSFRLRRCGPQGRKRNAADMS